MNEISNRQATTADQIKVEQIIQEAQDTDKFRQQSIALEKERQKQRLKDRLQQREQQRDANTTSLKSAILNTTNDPISNQGTTNENRPSSSNKPLSTTIQRLIKQAKFNQLQGILRVLGLFLFRPFLTSILYRCIPKTKRRSIHYYLLLLVTCVPSLTRTITRFIYNKIFTSSKSIRSGVYHGKPGSKSQQGAVHCKLQQKIDNYWITPYLNGDNATIFPTAIDLILQYFYTNYGNNANTKIKTVRKYFTNRDKEIVATDWTFNQSSKKEDKTKLCIFLAGVGGDSSALYIRECNEAMTKNGWNTVTINPRGLKNSPDVIHLKHSFNPYNLSDLDDLLLWIHGNMKTTDLNIVLCGFSLGAISTGKYVTTKGKKMDALIKGAVMVSGAWGMEFANWWRYKEIFQPLIVPDLCIEFLTRYGQKLEKTLTEKQLLNLGSASTYDEMVSNLLLPIIGTEGMTYLDFQKEGTSSVEERQNIDRPTLLMFSLDDPLHNPNQLGINANDIENKALPENLVYMVTEEGGHVSFPTHVSGRSDLLRSTVVEWSNFCLQ